MYRLVILTTTSALLWSVLACDVERPSSATSPTESPSLTPERMGSVGTLSGPDEELLATLPKQAGGVSFAGVQVVDDSLNAFHYVDDALSAVNRDRHDAVAVFRYSEESSATIGATSVNGVAGDALLQAFADTWHAAAVIGRRNRMLGGTVGWELVERGGTVTVLYRRGDTVYLAAAPDPPTLDAILSDMPPPVH
jgi:hypothetical protein